MSNIVQKYGCAIAAAFANNWLTGADIGSGVLIGLLGLDIYLWAVNKYEVKT